MKSKHHSFIDRIRSTISKHSMLSGGETVLIGLSGGPDSVCLLHVLHSMKDEFNLKLRALYIDHGLRPDETPDEIAFCRKICEELSIPFISKAIDVKTYAKEHGLSKQDAARELRYKAFDEAGSETGADRIALGHNADDQFETFLMRLSRGSGPRGLSGIPPVRGKVIRPLIEAERSEIEKFLDERRSGFIVDSSNLREDYLRNRMRLSFIPQVKKINPHIVKTVLRTLDIMREEERYFEIVVTKTLMKLISRKTDERIELFLAPLETMEKVILRRVLRRAIEETRGLKGMEFIHVEEIIDLIKKGKPGDRIYIPKGLRVIKNYSTLVMTSEIPKKLGTFTLNVPGELVLGEVKAVIKASILSNQQSAVSLQEKEKILLDADKIKAPLTVRGRKAGDFFYPLGFGKRKKLQDFFVDVKVPRDERDSIPLIVSGNDIVWIAGYRGDDRFRVTENTKRFLKLEFKRAV